MTATVNVVKRENESEYEWKISNFSFSERYYWSPHFKFESEYWFLEVLPNCTDGYIALRLWRSSLGSSIEVEFSVAIKTTEGRKRFERRERKCFEGWMNYDIKEWISLSESSNPQKEFMSSGCFTIILTMKRADSRESECASAAAASSFCKHSLQGDEISLDRNFLDKLVKCDEAVSLKNWFDHKCQISNAKAAKSASMCSCCKERLNEDKIAFHKECLDKEAKCPRCDEVINLHNWFDHICQVANVQASTSTSESSGLSDHYKILKQLLLNKEHSDVVFRVNGKKFPAHKAILAVRSPVFASTFRHEMKENKTGIVDIKDCDPSMFSEFLRFLYCNDLENLSGENVFDLFTMADKYDCPELRTMCVNIIKKNFTVKTFCKALALALLHSETELLHVATDFFIENADKILMTVEWQMFATENITYCNELFIKYVNSAKRSNS